jgi:alkylation response protein AidB-like acyl-CoA dehydrogenase
LKGNQSGPIEIADLQVPADRLVGPVGDGCTSNDEATDPFFLFGTAACWNGIALGMIDIAKKHTTRKRHVDVGMRVCDYPTIQDYVGEAIVATNTSRMMTYEICRGLDAITGNCDWTIHADVANNPRAGMAPWNWQVKYTAAANVAEVADKKLHACGGSGYKAGLGLERYLRDGKAGWLMAPTNEVIRGFIGKAGLLGFEALDLWNQQINQRTIDNEVKKMSSEQKRALAQKIMEQVN